MGNSFGPKRVVDRFESAGLIVDVPQIVVHEGDEPDVLVSAHRLERIRLVRLTQRRRVTGEVAGRAPLPLFWYNFYT